MKTQKEYDEKLRHIGNCPNPGFRLREIRGYWKANITPQMSPDNYGIETIYEPWDSSDTEAFIDMCEAYERDWVKSSEDRKSATVEFYTKQLNEWKDIRPFILMVNIWFLESHGFLTTDNYNGLMFMWEK